jgi:hypothetical protein
MKQIIEHAKKEKAVYHSDFSDYEFDGCGPDVDVKINFSYGSKYDGAALSLHLTDSDVECILDVIKSKITDKYKKEMTGLLDRYNEQYNEAVDFREWGRCDILGNNVDIIKHIIDYKEE